MPKLLSNPPFNMKWDGSPTVPSSNANFAFVEKALKLSNRAAFIFPISILDSPDCKETSFRKMLIENNLLESVIKCPEKMFEPTSISVCILTINKNKEDKGFMMIDASQFCEQEIREQAGQFGGKSHTNRIYKKKINIFSEDQISQIVKMVLERISIVGLSQEVFQEEIEEQDWCFTPARYIVQKSLDQKYRSFEEIIDDLNRVIQHQNINKLTINSTTAKELGLQNLKDLSEQSKELTKILNEELKDLTDKQILKPNFYTETKNKVLKFENTSKSEVSESFLILLSMWKQHIMYLNNEENRYLTELKERAMYHFFHEKVEDSTLTI